MFNSFIHDATNSHECKSGLTILLSFSVRVLQLGFTAPRYEGIWKHKLLYLKMFLESSCKTRCINAAQHIEPDFWISSVNRKSSFNSCHT